MVKVEVIETFTLGAFKELKNIKRIEANVNGKLFVGDIFECTEAMAEYLTGKNNFKKAFVKVIEIIPEKKIEEKSKKEPTKKPATKKVAKKTSTKTTTKKTVAKKK